MRMKKFTLLSLAILLSVVAYAQKPGMEKQRTLTPLQQHLQAKRSGGPTAHNVALLPESMAFTAEKAARRGGNASSSYSYSFTRGLNGWTTIDADGDGYEWYILTNEDLGGNMIYGHDGKLGGLVTSASYFNNALTPDNYLVSPKMKLDGKIEFYASAQDASWPSEYFGVYVSTAGNTAASDFTKVQEWTMTAAPSITPPSFVNGSSEHFRSSQRAQGNWYHYEVDLSGYNGAEGYVAIRHYDCTDMFRLNVDDITLTTSEMLGQYDPDLEKEEELVELPEGLESVAYNVALGTFYHYYGGWQDYTDEMSVKVAVDGSDIYIQGLAYYCPEGWIKGTLSNGIATFENGQFVGNITLSGTPYDVFMVGSQNGSDVASTIEFGYDEKTNTLTSHTYYVTESLNKTNMDNLTGYWVKPVFSLSPLELVTAPEGLEASEWLFKAQAYYEDGDLYDAAYTNPVFVGFDGNDVYVQGISEDMPDAWIKGTLENGKVTFAVRQYLGTAYTYYGDYPYFFTGYGEDGMEDVVMTLDADKTTLTLETPQSVLINGTLSELDVYLDFRDVVITKIPDVAAVPAQPEITGATLTGSYPNIKVDIPRTDEDGNPILSSKLSYQYYYDIDHEVNPVKLTTDLYTKLDEDMTEIPYLFTDHYDVYNYMFYLNMDFSKWNKIGIQSIYRGGDKENKSEIFWYTLKEYPTPVDVIVEPEDITDGNLTQALADKIASMAEEFEQNNTKAGNIIFNLAEDGSYTLKSAEGVSATIKGAYDITINGNGAIIDASEGDNIVGISGVTELAKKSDGTESDHSYVSAITFKDVTIKGMKKALVRDLMTKTLLETLTIDNCIIEVSDQKPFIDFDGRGYVGKVVVKNSTIWAAAPTNKNFAKYGSRPKNVDETFNQEFDFQNSTFVNISPNKELSGGQNLNNFSQKGTANNIYTLKNNIFVNTGKKGQVVQGINSNQKSTQPVWDVDGNVFNWGGADVSAAEAEGADYVQNSHAGIIEFTDAANGDFNGRFTAAPVEEAEESSEEATSRRADEESVEKLECGDPRWTIVFKQGYAINIDVTFGTVTTNTVGYAAEGDEVTITVKPNPADKFELVGVKVEGVNTDLEVEVTPNEENPEEFTFTMPADAVIITATFRRIAEDIIVNPEDIEGGDIAAALQKKIDEKLYVDAEGNEAPCRVRNITINLAEDGEYTVSGTIEAPANLIINGNGSAIDASALEGPMISMKMPEVPVIDATTNEAGAVIAYPIDNITVQDVTVEGLAQTFIKSNSLYLVKDLTVENSVIGFKGAVKKAFFDFSGQTGGNVINLTVNNSTLWADAATQWQNGGFFTSQSSKKLNQMGVADADLAQTTTITNSTIYNVANGKTTSTLVQNSQSWMKYVVKNNVIANSGKEGQFVAGLNAGQKGKAENWEVDGNVFNWNKNDIQETEASKIAGEMTNSLACRVLFSDVEKPDFGGILVLAPGTETPETLPGDPRWLLSTQEGNSITVIVNNEEFGTASAQYPYAIEGEEVGLNIQPVEGYEVEVVILTHVNGILIEVLDKDANSFTMYGEDIIVYVTFKKTTTGIDNVENGAALDEGDWFTVNGVRIDKPTTKGLYIHNGKKIVIK